MRKRKSWIAFTGLIILGLLLSGCAGPSEPAEKDTFICAIASDVGTLDPQRVGAAGEIAFYPVQGLTHWSGADNHTMPSLAESWENIDPLTWKFTIRQGVRFQNGQPMTSADVQFSFYRIMGRIDPNFPGSGASHYKALIDEIETPDDYTVIIHTKYPEVSMPHMINFMYILPKAYIEEIGDEEFAQRPIGTGVYKIVERKIAEYVSLEANEYYWNTDPEPGQFGPPQVKKVIYRIIPEEATRVAALKAGEVDAAQGISADTARELEKDPNINVYYTQRNQPAFIIMNWRAEKDPETGEPNPFCDVRVRQAMCYALDIDAIIENYLTGREYRTTMMGRGSLGYNPDIPLFEYNPEKARQLLTEAGYPNGFTTKLHLAEISPVYEAVCQYWRDVGINVELELTTAAVAQKAIIRKTLYGMVGWAGGWGPDIASTFFKSQLTYDGLWALHGMDEGVEELVEKQMQEFDEEKRAELIDEAIQIVYRDAWFIPLWEAVYIKAIRAEWDYQHLPYIRTVVLSNVSWKK